MNAQNTAPEMKKQRVIVDTDTGLDDAHAILYLLAQQNLKVDVGTLSDEHLLAYTNTYFGTVEEITEQLSADEAAARSTEVSFQVHSLDPVHELTLRSIELLGTEVAPRLGWTVES